ncbi:MAG: hypothetical protein PHS04_15170 [Tissierellia bacterium]|jgi:hypothetical protein|nr:hypothetical protein [Tissierellia bacterium]
MASEIAKFKFDAKSNNDGYEKAKEKLRYEFGQTNGWTTDSDGTWFTWASTYYIIIRSDIKDAGKAGDICRAHGGKPY